MSRTVALTGATGFIGQRISRLLVAEGWQLRTLVRDPQRAAVVLPDGVDLVSGSLEDAPSLGRLTKNVDAVVHCAGSVRGARLEDFSRVNVSGVERLISSMLDATERGRTPPRLLVLSSLAAREPQLSHYAASKRLGEQVLQRDAGAIEWVALRPPAVYGPGDRELLPLFRWMQRGIAPIVGNRAGRLSMLYVDDLAAAIECWLRDGEGVQGIFELHDGHQGGYSWDDLIAIAAALRGGRVIPLAVPGGLMKAVGGVSLMTARLAGFAPMLSPGKVRELRHKDWVCDDSAWREALPWRPTVQFAEGLRRTLIQ